MTRALWKEDNRELLREYKPAMTFQLFARMLSSLPNAQVSEKLRVTARCRAKIVLVDGRLRTHAATFYINYGKELVSSVFKC